MNFYESYFLSCLDPILLHTYSIRMKWQCQSIYGIMKINIWLDNQ
jgi:hypothetical protein